MTRRTSLRQLPTAVAIGTLVACGDRIPTSSTAPFGSPLGLDHGATAGLVVAPGSLALTAGGAPGTLTSSTQYAGAHAATSSSPSTCTVSPATAEPLAEAGTGLKKAIFTVVPVAIGRCAVTVTDRRGNRVIVDVTVAGVLGSHRNHHYGGSVHASSGLHISLMVGPNCWWYCAPGAADVGAIEWERFTAADEGRSILLDAATPSVAAFVAFLTDGVAQPVELSDWAVTAEGQHTIGFGLTTSESHFFGLPAGTTDFAGRTITSFQLELERIRFAPAPHPTGTGDWFSHDIAYTIRVVGY